MYEATTRKSPPTDQSVDYSCCRLCKKPRFALFGLFLFLFRLAASSCVPILLILLGSAAPSYISLPEPAYALPPSALQPLPLVLHQFLEPLRTGLSSQPCPNFLPTPGVVRLGQKVGPARVGAKVGTLVGAKMAKEFRCVRLGLEFQADTRGVYAAPRWIQGDSPSETARR